MLPANMIIRTFPTVIGMGNRRSTSRSSILSGPFVGLSYAFVLSPPGLVCLTLGLNGETSRWDPARFSPEL